MSSKAGGKGGEAIGEKQANRSNGMHGIRATNELVNMPVFAFRSPRLHS